MFILSIFLLIFIIIILELFNLDFISNLYICSYNVWDEGLSMDVLNMDSGNGPTGGNSNPNSGNNFGGSNPNPYPGPGPGNSSGGQNNPMSIQSILNPDGTLTSNQMQEALMSRLEEVRTQRRLDGIRSMAVNLNDAGYHFYPHYHLFPHWMGNDPVKQTLYNLYKSNPEIFTPNSPGLTNITNIINYYRNHN